MAQSVSCGANFTMVISHSRRERTIVLDQEEQEIVNHLKDIMIKKHTLAYFFRLLEEEPKKIREP